MQKDRVQNNSTFKNKLRNYSLLAGSAFAATAAKGQIIYHNLNPVIILNTNHAMYNLDLDGNGNIDYYFEEFSGKRFGEAAFGPIRNNRSIAGSIFTHSGDAYAKAYPYVLTAGEKISGNNKWFNLFAIRGGTRTSYPILGGAYKSYLYGNWEKGDTDKFIALRINSDSDYNYGWVRITVTPRGNSIKIKDYAYESIPDSLIFAGDTGTGPTTIISDHRLQNVSVYSSGKNVFVKYPNAREGMTITVTDLSGREVRSVQTTTELYEMNLSDASSGIYTITVRSKDAEMTKKVSIQ